MREAFVELLGSNRALRRISVSWFLVNLAEWGYITALAIYEYRLHGAIALGLIGARFVAGSLLGSLTLDVLIRRRPTFVLRLLSLFRAIAVTLIAIVVAEHGALAVIVVIVWIDATVAAPYRPVQASTLPALSSTPHELSAAAGSVPASKALAQAAGALLGSVALSLLSPATITALAAGVFAFAAAIVAPLAGSATAPVAAMPPEEFKQRRFRLGAITHGFELVAERARTLLLLGGTRSLTRGLWTSLAVVVSLRLLHLGETGVGLLMAAAGVGAAVAVPLSARLAGRERLAPPAAIAYSLAGLPIVGVGLIGSAVPAIVLIAIWGVAFALADAISNSLIHRVVEANLLAPSVAAIESSKLLLEGVGALLAPALLAVVGIRDALIIAGAPLPLLVGVTRAGLTRIDRRAGDRARPLSALRRTSSFWGLTMLELENLSSRLKRLTAAAGEEVIRQGDLGDAFYLIDAGSVDMSVDGYWIARLGPAGSFGQKALLRPVARSATITAREPTHLWCLERDDYLAAATGMEGPLAVRFRQERERSLPETLAGVPLFGALDCRRLERAGHVTTWPAGQPIVREGDPGDAFYVMLEGEAEVDIDGRPIRRLSSGDWFGEIALLHSVPRTATVTAATPLKLWVLPREAFRAALTVGAVEPGAPSNGAAVPSDAAGLLV